MTNAPVFTIIMDTYNRPAYLRQAVAAMRRQTYDKLQIILVNNGATPETVDYLHEVAGQDSRIRLIHFEENQYSPDDPQKMVDTCGNAAMRQAIGEYVWYQADDDWIADDYVEKMVYLFSGRTDCTTASGRIVCVDAEGRVLDKSQPPARPRYMAGHELALAQVRGDKTLCAPGTVFVVRRDVWVRSGGFHRSLDFGHLYGIVPFGVTGSDDSAIFYWRRHAQQLNLHLTQVGWLGLRDTLSLLEKWEIEERWRRVFGPDIAREVVSFILNRHLDSAAVWFAMNWISGNHMAAAKIAGDTGGFARFWWKAAERLWKGRKAFQSRFKTYVREMTTADVSAPACAGRTVADPS